MLSRLVVTAMILPLAGCVSVENVWSPTIAVSENGLVSASAKPACTGSYCYGFDTVISNKTDKPVEIDWNKSYYLLGGQTNGGLMTTGVVISQRNLLRAPDMILPKGSYSKPLWPSSFTSLQAGISSIDWVSQQLPDGKQGVYLTFRQGDREEYVTLELSNLGLKQTSNSGPAISVMGVNLMNAESPQK